MGKVRSPAGDLFSMDDRSAHFDSSVNLTSFSLEEARVILEGGELFENRENCIRLHLAGPRTQFETALNRIGAALLQAQKVKMSSSYEL
jgi:bifunctional pyridoxal-dependent enzyme with beta-cystathionase and maltose regulon repressor activities